MITCPACGYRASLTAIDNNDGACPNCEYDGTGPNTSCAYCGRALRGDNPGIYCASECAASAEAESTGDD